jgi:hypothetical protein
MDMKKAMILILGLIFSSALFAQDCPDLRLNSRDLLKGINSVGDWGEFKTNQNNNTSIECLSSEATRTSGAVEGSDEGDFIVYDLKRDVSFEGIPSYWTEVGFLIDGSRKRLAYLSLSFDRNETGDTSHQEEGYFEFLNRKLDEVFSTPQVSSNGDIVSWREALDASKINLDILLFGEDMIVIEVKASNLPALPTKKGCVKVTSLEEAEKQGLLKSDPEKGTVIVRYGSNDNSKSDDDVIEICWGADESEVRRTFTEADNVCFNGNCNYDSTNTSVISTLIGDVNVALSSITLRFDKHERFVGVSDFPADESTGSSQNNSNIKSKQEVAGALLKLAGFGKQAGGVVNGEGQQYWWSLDPSIRMGDTVTFYWNEYLMMDAFTRERGRVIRSADEIEY